MAKKTSSNSALIYCMLLLTLLSGCVSQTGTSSLKSTIDLTEEPSSKFYKKKILMICPEFEPKLDYAYQSTCSAVRKAAVIAENSPLGWDDNVSRLNMQLSDKKPAGVYQGLMESELSHIKEFTSEEDPDIVIYSHITQAERDRGAFNYELYAFLLDKNLTLPLTFEENNYDNSLLTKPIFWVASLQKILREVRRELL